MKKIFQWDKDLFSLNPLILSYFYLDVRYVTFKNQMNTTCPCNRGEKDDHHFTSSIIF